MAATIIKRFGHSAAIRIPATVLAEAGIRLGQPVEVRAEHGRIVIERSQPKAFGIDQLVKGIRLDNLHPAIDEGLAVGREAP